MSLFLNKEDGYFSLTTAGEVAVIILIAVLVILTAVISTRVKENKDQKKSPFSTKQLVFSAVALALGFVTSYIKIVNMPWGGSIVLAMVPIILFSVRWGLGSGLLAGFVFGVLQFMFDGGFAIGWQSIIGDYLLAFTVLGLAGLMKGKKLGVFWGTLIGGVARFLVHYVVGATIWAAYMPDTFFGMTMTSPWIYSLLYNIAYMGPNIIITLVIFGLLYVPMKKYMLGQDIH